MVLDLFLASMMRLNQDLSDRLCQAGITSDRLAAAKEQARAAGFLRGLQIPVEEFVSHFGPPLDVRNGCLTYGLRLWPQHVYEMGVSDFGGVYHNGFVLKVDDHKLSPIIPLQADSIHDPFLIGYHTWAEIKRVLGPPTEIQGWDAMEDWIYARTANDDAFVIELDFGLLSGIKRQF